jgi:hypothetical protein
MEIRSHRFTCNRTYVRAQPLRREHPRQTDRAAVVTPEGGEVSGGGSVTCAGAAWTCRTIREHARVAHPPLVPDDVRERLGFALVRRDDLLTLNDGDFAGADVHERQQLAQEFFFHLVGAIEVLAQLVNESRNLGLSVEDASAPRARDALPQGDPLHTALAQLYANTRRDPFPADPYGDEGLMYRIWNYRHQVTHRRRQPFLINIGLGTAVDYGTGLRGWWRAVLARRHPSPEPPRSGHFILDPRDPPAARQPSVVSIPDELQRMLDLVSARCEAVIALI